MLRLPFLLSALLLPLASAHAMVGGTPLDKETALARSTVLIKFGQGNRCTGSIIGPRAILTAAHCAKRDPRP
ncbi:MAG: trypsin-like serine protease, partial [Proteobacteria bacterium]